MISNRRGRARSGQVEPRDDSREPVWDLYGESLEHARDPQIDEPGGHDFSGQVIASPTRGRVELPPPHETQHGDDLADPGLDRGPLDDLGDDDLHHDPTSAPSWLGAEQYGYEDERTGRSPIYGGTEWRHASFQQRAFHEGGPDILDLYAEDLGFRGRGPRSYRRPIESITDDVIEHLTDHPEVDASAIDVDVDSDGVVILSGFVPSRRAKRLAEACCDRVRGVRDVRNLLEIGE